MGSVLRNTRVGDEKAEKRTVLKVIRTWKIGFLLCFIVIVYPTHCGFCFAFGQAFHK